ncbi:hypothetical protein BD94_1116 [Elizabethkingia anophelis NUHP1]|uniref:Uncharacterized protein n=1 Tax=Elizabethkingia anophelis NUHP1 TaxID=1338011 RepID=A0A077EBF7_9FLAO|nr:hypothetical protein BD94_1116 [Elizabethkingia anophelis NUHP1]
MKYREPLKMKIRKKSFNTRSINFITKKRVFTTFLKNQH